MLREGLLVTVVLLAAAASITPAVAALQLASDGNVDASPEPGKDTALHLLLFGEPPAKKKVTKKKPKCNFPYVIVSGGCQLPCYYRNLPPQANCYRPLMGGIKCPTDMYAIGKILCSSKNYVCAKGEHRESKHGCGRYCDDNTGERNRPCRKKKLSEPCPANYKTDSETKLWCVNKVCPEGHTPSRKDGSCEKGCPAGSALEKGKCIFICSKGYKSTPNGGCRV